MVLKQLLEVIDENDENYGKFIYRGKYYDEKDAAADARSQEVYALTKSKLVYLIFIHRNFVFNSYCNGVI